MRAKIKAKHPFGKLRGNLRYLPFLLLLSGFLITAFTNHLFVNSNRQFKEESFKALSHKIALRIQQRVDGYRLALQGVAGLFAASDLVSHEEFHNYVAHLDIEKSYPGIQAVGYAQLVSDKEKSVHVAAVRKQGIGAYKIYPEGSRAQYSPYVYIEPLNNSNKKALGFDALSEAIRHSVMASARDLNEARITDIVQLIQDREEKPPPSFIMFLPVYQKNMPLQTVSQRRAYIMGWVFIQFHMDGLMKGILEGQNSNIFLKLYDSKDAAPDKLMYENVDHTRLWPDSIERYEFTLPMVFMGHAWTLKLNQFEDNQPLAKVIGSPTVLITGGLLSLMLSRLIWQLIILREQADRLAKSTIIDLEESESRLKVAIDDAVEGLWDWNLEKKDFYFSDKAKNLLGFSVDEKTIDLESWEQNIHLDDKPEAIAKIQACLARKTSQYACEYRVNCLDSSYKWILDRGTVIQRDSTGKPLRIIGTLLDITERKQKESALIESEKRFRTVADAAPVLIWMSGVDMLCIWFNKFWLDFTGRTMQQELGNGWMEGIHPNDLQTYLGIRSTSFDDRKPFTVEYRLMRHDGEYRWLLDSGVPRLDEQGDFSGFMGSCLDISDLKLSQIALQDSEQRAQKALAELQHQKYALDQHAIVATTDVRGTITYVNDKFCQISGYSAQELIGQNHRILNSGHHPSEFFSNLYRTIANKAVWHGEICNRAKDGSLYWVLTTIVPFLNERGKPIQYIAIRADITAQKQADAKLKDSLKEKEMLLKEVYHRVKNNLQVVSSLLNLQAKSIVNTEAIELLRQSADRIKSMALLHEKLYQSKDLSKIDLHEYLHSLIEYLVYAFDIRGRIKVNMTIANIFLDVDTAIPCGLIVNEIVSNALKHAFPGDREGVVTIDFFETSDEYRILITDNGIGFPAGWELKNCTSLGLELVHELARQLLGEITFEGGNGTIFTLRFPQGILIQEGQ